MKSLQAIRARDVRTAAFLIPHVVASQWPSKWLLLRSTVVIPDYEAIKDIGMVRSCKACWSCQQRTSFWAATRKQTIGYAHEDVGLAGCCLPAIVR
eukprot:scaffold215074_cov21-Tisochrysis_lutea.AAC.1